MAKRKQNFIYILASISFVLAFYAFNANRVFVPLLMVLLLVVYHKPLFKNIKLVLFSGLVALLLLLPFVFYFLTPESKLRFQEVNIFTDIAVVKESNRLIQEDGNSVFSKIIHNRRVLYGFSYIKHYFDFFNPQYLFLKGDVNPRFSTQESTVRVCRRFSSAGSSGEFTNRGTPRARAISAGPVASNGFISATRIWRQAGWRSGSRDAVPGSLEAPHPINGESRLDGFSCPALPLNMHIKMTQIVGGFLLAQPWWQKAEC